MSKQRTILTGAGWAGVEVAYDQGRKLVTLSGWYDTYVGIAPETITLAQLLTRLGITSEDCRTALVEGGPSRTCPDPRC